MTQPLFLRPPRWGDRVGWRRWRRYWLIHPLEGALAWTIYGLLRRLPAGWASGLGGAAGRVVSMLIPSASARAAANLDRLFPERHREDQRVTIAQMWDHLGRCIAEYAVLDRMLSERRVTVTGLDAALPDREGDRPLIFFSGHFGNWEVGPPVAVLAGFPVQVLYRPPGNRFVGRLLDRIRRRCRVGLLPKSTVGARQALRVLRDRGVLGLLVDEKSARGVPVPALGRPIAEGGPIWSLARLAIASNAIVVPIRVERSGGAHFRIACLPPLAAPEGDDSHAAAARMVAEIDALMADWVRARPEQWLWLSQKL